MGPPSKSPCPSPPGRAWRSRHRLGLSRGRRRGFAAGCPPCSCPSGTGAQRWRSEPPAEAGGGPWEKPEESLRGSLWRRGTGGGACQRGVAQGRRGKVLSGAAGGAAGGAGRLQQLARQVSEAVGGMHLSKVGHDERDAVLSQLLSLVPAPRRAGGGRRGVAGWAAAAPEGERIGGRGVRRRPQGSRGG